MKHLMFTFVLMVAYAPLAMSAESSNSTQQVPGQLGSWFALGIIITAALTAWLMNSSAPKMRAFGTLLAALGCFSIVLWFGDILETGVLENPKPNQTPMDSAKPILLMIQTGIALIAGLMLLVTAFHQSRNIETLQLAAENESDRYGMVSRMIHWTTAILFITLIPMGIFASMIPEDAWYRYDYYIVHETLGVIVLALLCVRLFWNKRSKRPELDGSLKPSERKLAHVAHIALYILMVAIPVTGFFMTSYHGFSTSFFALQLEPLWGKSEVYIIWGTFHKYILQYLVYIILGAHILGALKHHFIDKHTQALKRMVS